MRHFRGLAILGAVIVSLGFVAACTQSDKGHPQPVTGKPNIVFVLTDDLSVNLVPYMPHVLAMEKAGVSFSNYTVTDSLCCPSRASIFSGNFPHDTHVFDNTKDDGGFQTFYARGEEKSTFATSLQTAGYQTAMLGKYLNGYNPNQKLGSGTPYVPPGWSQWDVAGNGYKEFDYSLNENHKVVDYGDAPKDYLTDVVSHEGSSFISSAAAAKKPFMMEIATFAPHEPYVPAPQDANLFPGLKAPRTPNFNVKPKNAPLWFKMTHKTLTAKDQALIDKNFRLRVQDVQSVDRMIGSLEQTLKQAGVANNTVLVFSSDNGFHLGEYGLLSGKKTAFETDVRVPLVVTGPGIPAGRVVSDPVENIDLAPTFDTLGGVAPSSTIDGHDFTKLLQGEKVSDWRTAALIEHHGGAYDPTDPDSTPAAAGNPPTYNAMRTLQYTYVEYNDGEREYYDRTKDPNELDNIAGQLPAARIAALHGALSKLTNCHGTTSCWAAGHVTI
jgi:arylsulfatase A-like enzyme